MLNPWAISLICLALFVMFLSRDLPRAWVWIGAGGASFFASSLFWEYGDHLYHPIFTFLCDATVCVCIFKFYKRDWETGVMLAFIISAFSSLLKMGLLIPNGVVYASLLEFCNACALLWIGTTGIIERRGRRENDTVFHRLRNHLLHARNSL